MLRATAAILMTLALAGTCPGQGFEDDTEEDRSWGELDEGPRSGDSAGTEEHRLLAGVRTVAAAGAGRAGLWVDVPVGRVEVEAGAGALLEARYEVPDSLLIPEFGYAADSGRGRLEMSVAGSDDLDLTGLGDRTGYYLRVDGDILDDLDISVPAGLVALSGVWPALADADIEVGLGQVHADLSGVDRSLGPLRFEVGFGQLELVLPSSIGVRVRGGIDAGPARVEGLTGTEDGWVNARWETAGERLEVEVHVDSGELVLLTAGRE